MVSPSSSSSSLRALKQALSLRVQGSQAGTPLNPAMTDDHAAQQGASASTSLRVSPLEANIGESPISSTPVQSTQQRSEHKSKCIQLPMKRSRLISSGINSVPAEKESTEAHAATQPSQQESCKGMEPEETKKKKWKRDDKKLAVFSVNRNEVGKTLFAESEEVVSSQAQVPLTAQKLAIHHVKTIAQSGKLVPMEVQLDDTDAVQEDEEKFESSHLNPKDQQNLLSGPSHEALSYHVPLPCDDMNEAVVMPLKARKKGDKAVKRQALPPNTVEAKANPHSGLLEEDVPAQVRFVSREEMIAEIEKAAVKAHCKLLAEGETVTVAKVLVDSMRDLNYVSLESLGLCMKDIPHLYELGSLEEKVNTVILCHLAVRKITTLYDLRKEILRAEKVKKFSKLEIGPLLLHPLVVEHFAPSTSLKIHKITAMDVLNHLSDYLDRYKTQNLSKLQVDGFLCFMGKERSLSSSEDLYVRVQNLGMYATYIVREKAAVVKLENKFHHALARNNFSKNNSNGAIVERTAQKRVFKQQVYSTQTKPNKLSKHVVYISSEEDEDAKDHEASALAVNKGGALAPDRRPCKSCPYPSAAEERIRLLSKLPFKLQEELTECELSVQELQAFVQAWTDVCLRFSIEEVLMQLVDGAEQDTSKRILILFKSHSATTILDAVVKSIKAELCNSLFNTSENVPTTDEKLTYDGVHLTGNGDEKVFLGNTIEQADTKQLTDSCTSKEQAVKSLEQVLQEVVCVLCEVLTNVGTTIGICRQRKGMPGWHSFCFLLKRILRFEKEVVDRLSVGNFWELKLGHFHEFNEMHMDRILKDCMQMCKSLAMSAMFENGVSEKRAHSFVTQVKMAVGDGEHVSHEFLMQLFAKQFRMQALSGWCSIIVQDLPDCVLGGDTSNCSFHFSSALLETRKNCKDGLRIDRVNNNDTVEACSRPQVGFLGNITSADARNCLLRAPMLCNLLEWSQWDFIFLPILGFFPDWLEKEGPIQGLVCLVTSDGTYLRIDESATIDTFLAAAAKGCGKDAAVQMVSIVAAYGGVDRVPHALLKCYSEQAIESLVGKSQSNCRARSVPFEKQECQITEGSTNYTADLFLTGSDKEHKEKYMGSVHFVFDLLACIPSEFLIFAASMVIPALIKVIPGVATALLKLNSSDEHIMNLHRIGLALGIVEWVSAFQSLFVPPPTASISIEKAESGTFNSKDNLCPDLSFSEVLDKDDCEKINQAFDECKILSLSEDNVITESKIDSVSEKDHSSTYQEQSKYEEWNQNECENAREVIAIIRKEEFGIDTDLPNKESDLLAKQHARLGRALQCLSQELYSQDSHFVLELVQNADDNQYADGVEATIVFILETKRIVVVNNELGFTSSNMRALCDVGNSTKSGSAAGYIGHKGIGFKSVFCVTDAPEVHSRGYHVKFDISEGKVGFLLPTVIPALSNSESVEKWLGGEANSWNTWMVFPLKLSILDGSHKQMLLSRLDDIHPSLLLFLHRLQRIIIKNELTGTLRILQKSHTDDGLVKLSDGTNQAVWLVVKQQLDAVVDRSGVKTTELALALPLREGSTGLYEACNEHQQVFAFLPLRSYGLRFIIQGDFVLPVSREEVDTDSAWNQWLLSEVPMVFMKTLEILKELDYFKQMPGKATSVVLSFVPLEGEVQGFFASLPRIILARLRASQCLPLDCKEGGWTFPCAVLVGWTDFSRTFLSDELLREHLGLYFLHKDVVLSPLIASALGVRIYGYRLLMNLMESLCSKADCLQNLGPTWVGSWFAALYKCIISEAEQSTSSGQPKFGPEDIEKLKQLPCVPLSNGVFTSLKEGPVWLPCLNEGNRLDDFSLVYSELRMVHAALLDPLDMDTELNSENTGESGDIGILISAMLQCLGVGQVLGHEVMIKHILPSMASVEFLEKQEPFFVQYMAFIMVHLQSNCSLCKVDRSSIMLQLQEAAIIATKNGPRRVNTTPIHFGLEFGCKIDAQKVFEGLQIDWSEVHPVYLEALKGLPQGESLSLWRQFFKDLGVTDFLTVKCHVKELHDKADDIWGRVPFVEFNDKGSLSEQDWDCPELILIMESLCQPDFDKADKLNKFSHLLTAFDSLWDECYSKYSASYWNCGRETKELRFKTLPSFVFRLRSYAWMQSSFDRNLYEPTQLYYRCSAIESLLGMHAPYAVPQIKSLGFVEALGLKMNVSVLHVLDLLKMWSQYPFEVSLSQMVRVYTFLWNETAGSEKDIVAFFQQNPCIFVPAKLKSLSDKPCKGSFYSSGQLVWNDETGCLAKLSHLGDAPIDGSSMKMCPKALNLVYPSLRGFLVDVCQVKSTLEFGGYVNVMKILAKSFSPSEVLPEVLAVLAKWSHDIDTNQMSLSAICTLKELLHRKQGRILPTTQNKWVSLNRSTSLVCWCDDEVMGQQLLSSKKVYYVCISSSSAKGLHETTGNLLAGQLLPFLKVMNISPLSKVVEREPTICGARLSEQMFKLLNWSLPYTQRYLQKWHRDIYECLQQSAFDIRLKKMQCFHTDRLSFCYKLPREISSGTKQFEATFLLQDDRFYATTIKNLNSLYFEFSRIYFDGTPNIQLANFLHLITLAFQSGSDEGELEALLAVQGIGDCSGLGNQWLLECPRVDTSKLESGPHKNSADDHLQEKELKQGHEILSCGQSGNKMESKYKNVVSDKVSFCKKSLAAVMNQIDAMKDLKVKGKQAKNSSSNKDVPAATKEGFDPSGKKSEARLEADNAVAAHADRTDMKLSKINSFENANVKGPPVMADFPTQLASLHTGMQEKCTDENLRFSNRDQIFFGHPCDEQAMLIGRLGEAVVFKNLMEKYGANRVRWMNLNTERGFPYDIIVEESEGQQLHVEVKATSSENKDWFEISNCEWEFAGQAGDRYVVARVFFGGVSGGARVVWLRDPYKLSQEKRIRLALIVTS